MFDNVMVNPDPMVTLTVADARTGIRCIPAMPTTMVIMPIVIMRIARCHRIGTGMRQTSIGRSRAAAVIHIRLGIELLGSRMLAVGGKGVVLDRGLGLGLHTL